MLFMVEIKNKDTLSKDIEKNQQATRKTVVDIRAIHHLIGYNQEQYPSVLVYYLFTDFSNQDLKTACNIIQVLRIGNIGQTRFFLLEIYVVTIIRNFMLTLGIA